MAEFTPATASYQLAVAVVHIVEAAEGFENDSFHINQNS